MHKTPRPGMVSWVVRRCRTASWMALLLAAGLSGCGGGGSDTAASVQDASASTLISVPAGQPGLVPQPVEVADVVEQGTVRQFALGRLSGGGYAVVWNVVDGTSWALWAQAYGPDGTRQGSRQLLLRSGDAPGIPVDDLSVAVLPDGSVVLAYITWHDQDAPGGPRVYEVRTRRLALDGTSMAADQVIHSTVTTGQAPFYRGVLQGVAIQKWDDGRYLVFWTLIDEVPQGADHPTYQMLRVDANGEPGTQVHDYGPLYAPVLRLATLDDGSWIASSVFPVNASLSHHYAGFVQFEAKHPLDIPSGRDVPFGSFVLGLSHGGAVFFSGDFGAGPYDVASPFSERFNPAGHPAGQRVPLMQLPSTAVALDDGSYVALTSSGEGQRFLKQGRALGQPFAVAGQAWDALDNGGMVAASAAGNVISSQRFLGPGR